MTRDEAIDKAARELYPNESPVHIEMRRYFKEHVKWADQNPLNRIESVALYKELVDGITLKFVKSEEELARYKSALEIAHKSVETAVAYLESAGHGKYGSVNDDRELEPEDYMTRDLKNTLSAIACALEKGE